MVKIVICGNSGSGKSTLAASLAQQHGASHLDLDVIAWRKENPTLREEFAVSRELLLQFLAGKPNWVIEGCYSDLLQVAVADCTELIFLNPGVESCIANCKARPWEAHKYPTAEAQEANLQMLIEWVRQYETRIDEFSRAAHQQLFDSFPGNKTLYLSNEESARRLSSS